MHVTKKGTPTGNIGEIKAYHVADGFYLLPGWHKYSANLLFSFKSHEVVVIRNDKHPGIDEHVVARLVRPTNIR